MERHNVAPRDNWQAIVEEQGLIWHGEPGEPYWDERAYYSFTMEEVERIEAATEAVYKLFLEAGDRIVHDDAAFARFGIPDYCATPLRESWRDEPPALDYGRFDFGYAGKGEPKLFEFNCDTPTAMLEAAVIQWEWKEARFPDLDQFNSLHEKLIDRWTHLRGRLPGERVWFTHADDPSHEDTITATYMRDLAEQAGLETHAVLIDDIGVDADGRIVDQDDQLITAIFKLYPWEWIVHESYGPDIVRHLPRAAWIEPIWKMIWSNKAILALLWEMFPNHPNLLAASFDPGKVGPSYVSKPILAREGANVEIVAAGETLARTMGEYRDAPAIYQALYPLRDFGQGYPVIGSWCVAGEAAGMGIREDGLITGNRARFVPHVIRG
jgi:glutathionylspermidine synthase